MDSHMVDEESLDLEDLQAQIDLSMSFAQGMISSWVKPHGKLSSRKRDTEAELKEYMRRPPRLGVGAAIPETASLSRETARLKGQLSKRNSKRFRDEEDARATEQNIDDDDEESRTRVIKKKARPDPFGGKGKIKNQKNERMLLDNEVPTIRDTSRAHEESEHAEVLRMTTDFTTVKSFTEGPRRTTPEQPNDAGNPNPAPTSQMFTSTDPASARRLVQTAALLKWPLLNLVSPPDADDSADDVEAESPGTSPTKKKKRRRRKRKKTYEAGAASAAAT